MMNQQQQIRKDYLFEDHDHDEVNDVEYRVFDGEHEQAAEMDTNW